MPKDWSFAGGFPGRTVSIDAVVAGGGLRLSGRRQHAGREPVQEVNKVEVVPGG